MWAVLLLVVMVGVVLIQWLRQTRPLDEFLGLYAAYIYTGLWHRVWTNGPSGFPAKGPAIVVSNHGSSPDPICILHRSPRLISWVAAREHYRASPITCGILDWMHCIPVTRGGQDPGALRTCLARLREGRIVGIFPEGNLTGGLLKRVRPGQQGAAYLALKTRAPVFPVYVAGGPRGEGLLKSWVYPSRGIRIYYGKPVDLSAYYGRPLTRQLLQEVTAYLMQCINALRRGARGKKTIVPQQTGRSP